MKRQTKKVNASAKAACFDIEVMATIKTRNLSAAETEDVKRKFKHHLARTISSLPFAHIYPFEVTLK